MVSLRGTDLETCATRKQITPVFHSAFRIPHSELGGPMSPTIRADPAARTLSVDAGKLCVRSVITTIDPDRAGDVVVPTGLRNHDDFMMNPVVLWAHNRTQFPPIGVCEWIDVQPRRVVAETRFAQGVRFSEDIFRLYEQGVLRGWSI